MSDHPVNRMMQLEYNPNSSAMTAREAEIGHLLTWGNSFTQIVRSRRGEILRLQPIGPDLCRPKQRDNGTLYYEVRDPQGDDIGKVYELSREEMLHTPYFSFDSLCGMSVVRLARSTIRQGMGQDATAERFVNRGIRPPGAIKFPAGKKFKSPAEAKQFRERFNVIHLAGDSDQQVVILEDGADWQQLGIDPESAQLLESRKFTRLEVAGLYHIPPHLSGDVEKTTAWGTGIEELNIGFVVYCLLPILRRIENERNRKLFTPESGLYCEHSLQGLLRGDALKRAQSLEVQMRNGALTVNEWRRLEGRNPLDGGNVTFFPLNMGRVGEDGEVIPAATDQPSTVRAPAPSPSSPPQQRVSVEEPIRRAFIAAINRCLRKESAEAVKAAKKPNEFLKWIDEFYEKHSAMVSESCDALAEASAAARGCEYQLGSYANQHCQASRVALLAAAECQPSELPAIVEKLAQRWQSERATETVFKFLEQHQHAI